MNGIKAEVSSSTQTLVCRSRSRETLGDYLYATYQTLTSSATTVCSNLVMVAAIVVMGATTAFGQGNWLEKAASKKIVAFDGTAIESHADVNKNIRGKVVVRRIRPQAKSDWN